MLSARIPETSIDIHSGRVWDEFILQNKVVAGISCAECSASSCT